MEQIESLPAFQLAYPGPLRDQLVAAVLSGAKTATASLRDEYEPHGPDPLPQTGDRGAVVDSEEQPVAIVETTEVRVVPAGEVDEQFARDEGEGFESVADWRAAHERFWGADRIDNDTLVVCERFRVVERL